RLARVRSLQQRMARTLTALVASMCGGLAFTPIPVADIGPITSLQASLVIAIAYIGGRELSRESAAEFVGALGVNLGVGMALREAARAAVKLIPGAGGLVSASVAFAGTWAVGAAAEAYFIDQKNMEAAKRRWREVKREGEQAHERDRADSD
ncbi:MAG: hypothetical protein AAGA56_26190, partial [Myxococcota bacterium]